MVKLLLLAIFCSICGGIGGYAIQEPVYLTPDSIIINAAAPEDK